MHNTLYGIVSCDSVKKARLWLDEHRIPYHFHHIKQTPIPVGTLADWLQQHGWEVLVNRRGTTWRTLDEATRQRTNHDTALELLQTHPSVMKRPVLVHEGGVEVGFSAAAYARVFSVGKG